MCQQNPPRNINEIFTNTINRILLLLYNYFHYESKYKLKQKTKNHAFVMQMD